MTIWILVLLLLASTAGLGYRQGAIRVAFSFVGILIAALLSPVLGHLIAPLFRMVGLKNPVLLWLVPPVIVFVIIMAAFKSVALVVHKKVEVHYKYHAGDLRFLLWERLMRRVGLCLGIANGAAYTVLLCFVFYTLGYWTSQVSTDSDPWTYRLLTRLGRDVQSSGMVKVARAVDGMPASYYDAADVAGMLYHTPLLQARLYRYPAFLGLTETAQFKELTSDTEFTDMWHRQAPISQLLKNGKVQAVTQDPQLIKTLWSTAEPNLQDLRTYLETGKSPKYDSETILGRWNFDVRGAILLARQAKTNISSAEMLRLRKYFTSTFTSTSFIAATDQQAILKNMPRIKNVPGGQPVQELQTLQGQWKTADGKYLVTLNADGGAEEMVANIQGDRLTLAGQTTALAFIREQ